MTPLEQLADAVRYLHGSEPTWVETVTVTETFEGSTAWAREVSVFDLGPDAPAKRCFAWVERTPEGKDRYFAVLMLPPIECARDAVQASIIQDARGRPAT